MEEFAVLLIIAIIVIAILSIILFFKVWGMTNNVKKIKEHLLTSSYSKSIILREIKKQNPHIDAILFDAMWSVLEDLYLNVSEPNYKAKIEYFKKLYEQAGVPFPEDVDKIKSDADYKEYIMKRN